MLPFITLFLFALIWLFLGLGYITHSTIVKSYNNVLRDNSAIYRAFSIACLSARQQLKEALLETFNYYALQTPKPISASITSEEINKLEDYVYEQYDNFCGIGGITCSSNPSISVDQCLAYTRTILKENEQYNSLLLCIFQNLKNTNDLYTLLTSKCNQEFNDLLDSLFNKLNSNGCLGDSIWLYLTDLLVKEILNSKYYPIYCLNSNPSNTEYQKTISILIENSYANFIDNLNQILPKLTDYLGNNIIVAFSKPIINIKVQYNYNNQGGKINEIITNGYVSISINFKGKNFAKLICNLSETIKPTYTKVFWIGNRGDYLTGEYGVVYCKDTVDNVNDYLAKNNINSIDLSNFLTETVLGNSKFYDIQTKFQYTNNEVVLTVGYSKDTPKPYEIYSVITGKIVKIPILENNCNDNRDNDKDGLIDCEDTDCLDSIYCNPQYSFSFYSIEKGSFLPLDCERKENSNGKLVTCFNPLGHFRVSFYFPLNKDYFYLSWNYNVNLGLVGVFYDNRLISILVPPREFSLDKMEFKLSEIESTNLDTNWIRMVKECGITLSDLKIESDKNYYYLIVTGKLDCCKKFLRSCNIIIGDKI